MSRGELVAAGWRRATATLRALRLFLRGFTGLATAPPLADAAAQRARDEAAARRPRCC